jgi:hypothetical protein
VAVVAGIDGVVKNSARAHAAELGYTRAMKNRAKRALASAVVIAGAAASSTALAQVLTINDVSYSAGEPGATLKAVKVGAKDAILISGVGTPVKIDCGAAVAKSGANKTLSSVKVGIRHVDKGTHGFQVALASPSNAARPSVKAYFSCDESPVLAYFLCDASKPAAAGASATITPKFAGSKTFSVKIIKSGAVVKTLTGQSGALTIPDFDTAHDGKEETLGVTLAYGLERAGSWTMKVEHDAYTLLFTAESPQKPLVGGGQLALSTSGLESITLVDQQITFGEASAKGQASGK